MKAWLKGGVIGIIIGIIYSMVFFSCTYIFWESHAGGFCMVLELLPVFLIMAITRSTLSNWIAFPLIFILNLIIFFGIGALAGLIIGKIKSKK